MKKMHRRGIRICIGGDYGFAWNAVRTNAKDIQTFVDHARLHADGRAAGRDQNTAARSWGGHGERAWSGSGSKAIWPTSLLVDGDPVADVRILQDKTRIPGDMKDGGADKALWMHQQRPQE